jgi:transcriptional regulator with PAS, ATPase and Fis domain
MQDTDTKPLEAGAHEVSAPVLRVSFSLGRPLDPPPIVRVSTAGARIGRSAHHDVCLDDTRVSRHHATVSQAGQGRLEIVDERSKNGTFVNGSQTERAVLAKGDVVSIGDSCMIVGDEPTDVNEGPPSPLIGDSAAIRRARAHVQKLGPTLCTVLLIAETGCGKEVVARALHEASGLGGQFVAVNCAALPESLFESQLFGHKAGAFTGAAAHEGFFRAARGGTLFLDEIGELALVLQPKLLRAIQERAVVPLGATSPVPCPVRLVAATNRDLAREVERGGFRADLLARLFEAQILLPPLRDRREDVLPIFAGAFGRRLPPMTHALAHALLLHEWPFNVRELRAVAADIAISSTGESPLVVDAFRRRLETMSSRPPPAPRRAASLTAEPVGANELAKLLMDKSGSVADVARTVGRSRRQVYRWIAKHGLRVDEFRR